jgi:hypothetical protein
MKFEFKEELKFRKRTNFLAVQNKVLPSQKKLHFFLDIFSFGRENKEIMLYALALFIIPFISMNQLIVGTLVNAVLINSAITCKTKKVFLLAIIPSIAAFSAGILFANLTPQLLLMLPFIWIGNFVLMYLAQIIISMQKKNYFVGATLGATAKTLLLFFSAELLFTQALVPVLFLTAFGAIQFITAISGAILVFVARNLSDKFFNINPN